MKTEDLKDFNILKIWTQTQEGYMKKIKNKLC